MPPPYRHTKIVFTIGPATSDEATLEKLVREGADICRLNMAHADHEWTSTIIRRVRSVCERVGRHVAILMDVKGPEIRTAPIDETIELEAGQSFDFTTTAFAKRDGVPGVGVNYPGLAGDIKVGDTVLVDSGLLRMEVTAVWDDRVRCTVLTPGPLGSRRHINLPGVHVNLPALTEKDRGDVKLGVQEGVEFFALSFVRTGEDLHMLRGFLEEHSSEARIIAKIEDQSGISNLDEILEASNGLMVARGDLGIEIPYEDLPLVQREAVGKCLKIGKPVIIATHLLESMITSPMPTRAEISDVANAVFEQADCVMLSGETTVGRYPVDCLKVLKRIIRKVEHAEGPNHNATVALKTERAKMLRAAVILADELDGAAIVVFTRSGFLARVLSSLRPRKNPIYAFTDSELVFKQSMILWGVEPFLMEFSDDFEVTIENAMAQLKKLNWCEGNKPLVVISNIRAGGQIIDSIQLRWDQ